MWRNATVQALLRENTRREQAMQAQIKDLLDRVMLMAGTPWTPAPIDLQPDPPQPERLLYPEQVFDLEA